jgi:phospho-N-acetylmuramoyl-pentapeptide-transferase
MELTLLKVIAPALCAFVIGILITPIVTHFLYKYRVWKKQGGKTAIGGHAATEFNRIKGAGETKTPRMGGIVIWASTALTIGFLGLATWWWPDSFLASMNFLSRSQTWIPLSVLLLGAGIGWLNDFYDVTHQGTGLSLRIRLLCISLMSGGIGWWFFTKLGVTSIAIPWLPELTLGWIVIPFFIALSLALYASGVIDGIDGLSGGVFAAVFSAYAGVALINGQFDLAAFCLTLVGSILAFLWFNIPPARFWMTETGSMPLTLTIAVVALMTDTLGGGHGVALLPLIALPLVVTVLSNIIQLGYRRATGRKFFRVAPLHHHFEAIGWPSEKVTMRYWVISIICALLGVVVAYSV